MNISTTKFAIHKIQDDLDDLLDQIEALRADLYAKMQQAEGLAEQWQRVSLQLEELEKSVD